MLAETLVYLTFLAFAHSFNHAPRGGVGEGTACLLCPIRCPRPVGCGRNRIETAALP
jgi:hypothetical protein